MMKKTFLLFLCSIIVLPLFADKWDNKTSELEGKKILVFTKNSEGYVHDNISASIDMFFRLGKENNFSVDTTTNSAVFKDKNIFLYDAVVFSNTNNKVFENEQEREGFKRYVQSGRGFMGLHSVVGTERDWDWFKQMVGGTFDFHPVFQAFTVKTVDSSHPCTKKIPDNWVVKDELYVIKEMNPTIRVMMVSDFSSPDFNSNKPITDIFGKTFPCVWTNDYDGGRQWISTLGHDKNDYSDSTFVSHITGGLEWVLSKDILYILAIGNSFSQDALDNHFYEIAQAADVNVSTGNAVIGGCPLERHWNNAKDDNPQYNYQIQNKSGKKDIKESTISNIIKDKVWDVITVQQASPLSGMIDSYFPYLTNLVAYIKENSWNPDVKIAFHQTWAYDKDSQHQGFANYHNNQDEMYNAIIRTVEEATKKTGIQHIIPSGTAIRDTRKKLPSSRLTRDGYHLSFGIGRYTAACTWFETITGISVKGNSYVPESMSKEETAIIQQTVHDIVVKYKK
jgi:type 1 glutamine amidotransferase